MTSYSAYIWRRDLEKVTAGPGLRPSYYHLEQLVSRQQRVVDARSKTKINLAWVWSKSYMAKKKFDWNMVTVRLDKSDQKKVHQTATAQEIDWHAAATALGGLGYKISMTWVDDRLAWVVTATGQADHAINPASSISSWSQDPEEALILTWYKVCVVFDGGKWVSENDDIPWG